MTTQSLSDHLASAYEAPEGDEARAAFRVESPDEAEWAMRRLVKFQRELAAVREQAATERYRIATWLEAEEARIGRDVAWSESLLTEWHRRLCDAELAEVDGDWSRVRHKTRRLPSGEVSARQAPDSWQADEEAFLAWIDNDRPDLAPYLVRVKREPRIGEAKRILDAAGTTAVDPSTGEVVPGITVTPGEIHYTVKVGP